MPRAALAKGVRRFSKATGARLAALKEMAREKGVILEQNFSSQHHSKHYRKEFWELVPAENKVLQGIDAHSISDMERFVLKRNGGQA